MKTIIIDDEPQALKLLSGYIAHFNSLELVGSFRNGLKALEYLGTKPVDLVFLDINMPHISGMELSRLLPHQTKVVFTTAYSQYAVESYEIEAVDYLLKPISLQRFSQAVMKLLPGTGAERGTAGHPVLNLKSGKVTHRVKPHQLTHLKKDGNYMYYYTEDGKRILCRHSVSEAAAGLPTYFLQTHRSYIVNMKKLQRLEPDYLVIHAEKIPLSNKFRKQVLRWLDEN